MILENHNRINKFTKHGTEERTPPELTTVNCSTLVCEKCVCIVRACSTAMYVVRSFT